MYHLMAKYTPNGRWYEIVKTYGYTTANSVRKLCVQDGFETTKYVILYLDQ